MEFHPGLNLPCQKGRDQILSSDEEREKRHVKPSSWDEILQWACLIFDAYTQYAKFNMFEDNDCQNKDFIGPFYIKWNPKNYYHLFSL